MPYLFASKFDYEIRRGLLDRGLKLVWGGFRSSLRRYISDKVRDKAYVIINH